MEQTWENNDEKFSQECVAAQNVSASKNTIASPPIKSMPLVLVNGHWSNENHSDNLFSSKPLVDIKMPSGQTTFFHFQFTLLKLRNYMEISNHKGNFLRTFPK